MVDLAVITETKMRRKSSDNSNLITSIIEYSKRIEPKKIYPDNPLKLEKLNKMEANKWDNK